MPRFERFEERGRDGDDAGRVLKDAFFTGIEPGELSRCRRRAIFVHAAAFFGEDRGDGMGFVDERGVGKLRREVGKDEVARIEDVARFRGKHEPRRAQQKAEACARAHAAEPQLRMGLEPEIGETFRVRACIGAPYDELDLDASASERVTRLDRLDAVRALHRKADISKVDELHEGSTIS